MFLCFLYGGFSIITLFLSAYGVIWRTETGGISFFDRRPPDFNSISGIDANRFSDANAFLRTERLSIDPFASLLSPSSLLLLVGGLIAISAGIAIWFLIREKEIKKIKQETANNLLLPDEKAVIEALKKSNFESTQAKLAKEAGMNKVQVHRAIKRLEAKGVLEKHGYGLTNKILLKKELFE
ncbi:MAG: hypothetical protein V1494_02390 [Candidatus Diapherotrites archaeon]